MTPPSPHPPKAAALTDLSGTVLEQRYELGRVLGAGGMGAVFEARHLRLDRPVAIKVLRPVFVGHDEYIQRFLREAKAASKIRNRNVVEILDYGETPGGLVYSVMECLVGQDLEQFLTSQPSGRVPWAWASGLLTQIANGLKAAHNQGVIHRDIKPANCFLTDDDGEPLVKLLDFGIAKLEDGAQTQQLTGTAQVLGTPTYIAPELARTKNPASPRSDIYSFGVVAYRMLTGKPPFSGDTAFEVIRRACMDPVPSLRAQVPDLPPAVESFVMELLAKEPEDRPADMLAVRERLIALGRETLGAQAVEIPASSALSLDLGSHEAPAKTERAPAVLREAPIAPEGPAEAAARERLSPTAAPAQAAIQEERPAVEITAAKLGPVPEDLRPQPPRDPGVPPTVVVGTLGAPQQAVYDPTSSPSRGPGGPSMLVGIPGAPQRQVYDPTSSPSMSGDTTPTLGEATLRLGESGSLERPRRNGVLWVVYGGITVIALFGGMALSNVFKDDGAQVEGKADGSASGQGVAAANAVHTTEGPSPADDTTGESSTSNATGIPGESASGSPGIESAGPPVNGAVSTNSVAPEPPEPQKAKDPRSRTARQPKAPSGPPPDQSLRKMLERKINAKCSTKMAGKAVSVSFFVTKSGEVSMLTATPKNAAGQCAKDQVKGTQFRTRKKDATIKIIVE